MTIRGTSVRTISDYTEECVNEEITGYVDGKALMNCRRITGSSY